MRHRVFLYYLLTLLTPVAASAQTLSSADVAVDVKKFVERSMVEETGNTEHNFNVTVSNLDPRLSLAACDKPLHKRITSPRPYGRNLSVKVACKSPNRWAIYVPVQIEQFGDVAVLSRSLSRGAILSPQDIELHRVNLYDVGYGYLKDPQQAVGMELKRPLQAGDAVRLSHLKKPQLVKKGERVILEASNQSVSVVTSGHAITTGQLGDQIKVKNSKSDRIVDATVVAEGRARVGF